MPVTTAVEVFDFPFSLIWLSSVKHNQFIGGQIASDSPALHRIELYVKCAGMEKKVTVCFFMILKKYS